MWFISSWESIDISDSLLRPLSEERELERVAAVLTGFFIKETSTRRMRQLKLLIDFKKIVLILQAVSHSTTRLIIADSTLHVE